MKPQGCVPDPDLSQLPLKRSDQPEEEFSASIEATLSELQGYILAFVPEKGQVQLITLGQMLQKFSLF